VSTDYTHFTKLAFDNLFARKGPDQEIQIFNADSGAFTPGPIGLDNGTVGGPALAFATDADTGIYRVGADTIGFACNGGQRLQLDSNALTASVALAAQDGAVGTPGIAFKDDLDTGIFRKASNDLAIACGGVEVFRVDGSGDCTVGRNASSVFKITGLTAAAGASGGSIGNRPDAAAGNSPATWLVISINGTLRYIPAW
jgi:hypothetical protein